MAAQTAKKQRQLTLHEATQVGDDAEADEAVASFLVGCDIAINNFDHCLFRKMLEKVAKAGPKWKCPNRKKVVEKIVPRLHARAKASCDELLKKNKQVGRTLTGDGATKRGRPLIDFLVQVPGSGVALLDVID